MNMQENNNRSRNSLAAGSLALLAVVLIGLIILSDQLLSGWRLDLTRNQQYTLSEGTENVLADLSEPVNLYLFFSSETSRELPQVRRYAQWVREMLDEMEDRANGRLIVSYIDPKPFSPEEDRAAAFGLQAVPVDAAGDALYLGLAGTNSLDDALAIPFLQPSKEQFLEYDLAKMISRLSHPQRKRVALLSDLDMAPGFDPATQGMRPAWTIYEQLQEAFEIAPVSSTDTALPDNIDLLMVVHPKALSDAMLYAIDQFVLGGGRLMAFVDPFAEADAGNNTGDPMAGLSAGSPSSLGKLFDSWGIAFDTTRIVGDALFALQVGMGGGAAPVRHLGILSLRDAGLNDEDIVTADLEAVNFSSSGWFEPAADSSLSFTPLVMTSENAAPIPADRLRFLANPADLMNGFEVTGNSYVLAARLSGPAVSAFEAAPEGEEAGAHLATADEQGVQILLFADTDMLSDRFWVQKQNFLGQSLVNAFADNGNMVINAVDHLLGSSDLISIRTRAATSQPFDRVEALRLDAESRFRETEEQLQLELEETERQLAEMQTARSDGDLTVLSDEQQQALQKFMDQRLQIRRDLRDVRHNLDQEIDALGTRLKFINIVLAPVMVALFALFYSQYRRRQRAEVSA